MAKGNHPSYISCIADILSTSAVPLSMDSLVARIEAQRPIGKGVRSAVYQAINKLYQAIPVAPGYYGWLSYLLKDQWFRHPLNSIEIRKGYLLLDELEHAVFFPEFFQSQESDMRTVRIEMMGGETMEAQAQIEQGTWALRLGLPFVEWVDQLGGATHDDLLICVKDAVAGEYGLRLQPRESRQEEEIAERNRKLVKVAEEIVSADRKSRSAVPVWELAAALIGRNVYANSVPPDDMHYVLHEFSRLRLYEDLGYTFEERIASLQRERSRFRAENYSTYNGIDVSELPLWSQVEGGPQAWEKDLIGDFWADDLEDLGEDDAANVFWDFQEGTHDEDLDEASAYCEGYQSYLSEFENGTSDQPPLTHIEFHLLEAELEMLVGLEQEFGYLMPEQEQRKVELAERLFIDLNYFFDDGDWDQSDFDEPPYWDN